MKSFVPALCVCFLFSDLASAVGIATENPSSNLIPGTSQESQDTYRRWVGMTTENPSSNLISPTWKESHEAYQHWTESLKEVEPSSVLGNNRTIGLLTFPNSGTVWLRKLVSEVTNQPEFSVYSDETQHFEEDLGMPLVDLPLLNHGKHPLQVYIMPEKNRSMDISEDDVVLVKDHGCYYSHGRPGCNVDDCQNCLQKRIDTYDGMIHLVRNPYDNLVARYHLGCWNGNNDCSKEALERRWGIFSEFWKTDINKYVMQHCSFSKIAETLPSLTVVYEDLLTNPFLELKRILRFMDREDISDQVIRAAIQRDAPDQAKVDIILSGVPEHTNEYNDKDLAHIEHITSGFLYNGCDI